MGTPADRKSTSVHAKPEPDAQRQRQQREPQGVGQVYPGPQPVDPDEHEREYHRRDAPGPQQKGFLVALLRHRPSALPERPEPSRRLYFAFIAALSTSILAALPM